MIGGGPCAGCKPAQGHLVVLPCRPQTPSLQGRRNAKYTARLRTQTTALPSVPKDADTWSAEGATVPIDDGFISSSGRFFIRQLKGEDMQVVCNIQANAFHTPLQPAAIDRLSKTMFKAEVRAALASKLQSAPTNTFAILVAKPTEHGPDAPAVAVLEIFLSDEAHVLKHIPPDAFSPLNSLRRVGYGWLASMAVAPEYQRTGCATALLAAAHEAVSRWNYGWTALHVYEDNDAALQLYAKEGYREVDIDPFWRGWLGGKRRILMLRQQTVT